MSDYEPKVGDRVSFRVGDGHYRRDAWGEVMRVTKATAVVKSRGEEHVFRRSKYGGFRLHKETDAERARREWLSARPKTKHAYVSFGLYGRDFESIHIRAIESADTARSVAVELVLIATWLDKRPSGDDQ